MNTAAYFAPPLTRTRLGWALAALVATALPFVDDVPAWILLLLFATSAWRYLASVRGWRPPHGVFRFFWTLANFALVFISFGTINGLEAGTALLLVMAAMKLTETTRSRDLVVIVFMSFFLVVAHALFDQSLFAAVYAVLCMLLAVTSLLQVGRRGDPVTPRRAATRGLALSVQALPVLLVMFLLFPRVPGPFWSLPSKTTAATGLSDSMEAGSIARLLQSSDVAFRAEFNGPAPPPGEMYWRGPVFSEVRGNRWTPGSVRDGSADVAVFGAPVDYTITLEPHRQQWLFGLDAPAPSALPSMSTLQSDLQLLSDKRITERQAYTLRSYTEYALDEDGLERWRETFLDTKRVDNPRTRALAERWRAASARDEDLITLAYRYFRENPFIYTLEPPPLTSDSKSDEFLFDTRSGFCEHFASSFALLMRYAGVPARIVTGYQGGELNPISGHYTVRQSDAHAWTEIWLEGQGWQRVDPTGAVAPDRVRLGIQSALRGGEALPSLFMSDGALLRRLRHTWDAINAAWNDRVLGYGQNAQLEFLRKLGIDAPSAAKLVALLSLSMVVILVLLSAFLAARRLRAPTDPALALYRRFCKLLARHEVPRAPHEGPLDYSRRAALALPELAEDIDAVSRVYVAQRYGPSPSRDGLEDLKQRVRRFSRHRRRRYSSRVAEKRTSGQRS